MSATPAENFDRSLRGIHVSLADRVGAVVKSGHPFAYCFPCLAQVMMLPEKRIRDAAQILVGLRDFHVRGRVCYRCERTDDTIVMIIE